MHHFIDLLRHQFIYNVQQAAKGPNKRNGVWGITRQPTGHKAGAPRVHHGPRNLWCRIGWLLRRSQPHMKAVLAWHLSSQDGGLDPLW